MSAEVPEGWAELTLGEIFARDTPGFWGDDEGNECTMKVLRATNLKKDGTLNYSTAAVRSFPEKKATAKALQYGDIILERSGGSPTQPVGRVAYFQNGEGFSASNFMQIIRTDKQKAEGAFCYYWMDWFYKKGGTELLQKATTGIRNLDYQVYKSTLVKLPPLAEQRRIAEILSSVDEAIQTTQAVIEQTGKIRLRLLHDLFHRGQWDEGKPLPEGWKLRLLDEVARRGSGHTPSKSYPEYWNGGVKWVSLQDTKRLDDVIISETTAEISDLGIANSSAVLHPAGTVVISRDATVGRSAILASPMAVSQHFIAWICSPKLYNLFLYYWLQHMKPVFERIGAGSTIKTIGLPFFKRLAIPLPPLELQVSLSARMMEIDQAIRANKAEFQRLLVLKAALMSDLLTGRRRVSDSLTLAAE